MPIDNLKLKAQAKINLFLYITGKCGDLHELQSLIVFGEIGDDLSFLSSDNFSLNITGKFSAGLAGDITENLIYKAAYLLANESGVAPKVKIDLVKNIPIAAGLGGGSADAAAALIGLNKFWNLKFDMDRLKLLGEKLGADVPACLDSKSLFIEGVGEKIKPISIKFPLHIVLVNPLIGTSTKEVFNNFKSEFSKKIEFKDNVDKYSKFISFLKIAKNDLSESAIKVTPVIADILLALKKTNPEIYRMSGSGATCFAIYKSKEEACSAVKKIKSKYSNWWVVKTVTFI